MCSQFTLTCLHNGTFLVEGRWQKVFASLQEAVQFILSQDPARVTVFDSRALGTPWTLERKSQTFSFSRS